MNFIILIQFVLKMVTAKLSVFSVFMSFAKVSFYKKNIT